MQTLALNGHKDAIFQMAYTYAWIPNDTESDRRKRLLGWEIVESGDLQGQPVSKEHNKEAVDWLERSISATDSADYKSLYWLSFYYLNGLVVKQDLQKANELLERAQIEAGRENDYVFKNKVDNTLNQLKQLISK
jgi:TPR repeat protein